MFLAVADSDSVNSSTFNEESMKNQTTPAGITNQTPIIVESNLDVNQDSTATITSTTGSIFSNAVSGFLSNRKFNNQQHLQARKSSQQSPARMASFSKNLKYVTRVSSRNLNISLARSKLYNSFPNLARKDQQINSQYSIDDENVRKVLKAVESDHVVSTNVADNRIRRTVYIEKRSNAERFGFTIQSYTFRHTKTAKTEQVTYVDYVDLDSPAFVAGLRAGDIILSINGKNVQHETHKELVNYIGQCSSVRMVVLFENCVNRIELCARAIKLKKLLADKEFELRMLQCQEERILSGMPPFTDAEILALLRTPCNTPRSVSFSLPNTTTHDGSTNCLRRPSAPPKTSSNVYYVNGNVGVKDSKLVDDISTAAGDDVFNEQENINSVIHYVDVDDDDACSDVDTGIISQHKEAAGGQRHDECVNRSMNDSDKNSNISASSWEEVRKAEFILGGSDVHSLSTQSSVRRSVASALDEPEEGIIEQHSSTAEILNHQTEEADELALIHILHIDDIMVDDQSEVHNDVSPNSSTTHF